MIQKVQRCFESNSVLYTRHAKYEMKTEEFGRIFDHEVCEAIYNGEVIEAYPEDKPYPSVLIFGRTIVDRPLHIVCAYDNMEIFVIIITVYQPNPKLWMEYKRRKKS